MGVELAREWERSVVEVEKEEKEKLSVSVEEEDEETRGG